MQDASAPGESHTSVGYDGGDASAATTIFGDPPRVARGSGRSLGNRKQWALLCQDVPLTFGFFLEEF